jgi:hypothetical protein
VLLAVTIAVRTGPAQLPSPRRPGNPLERPELARWSAVWRAFATGLEPYGARASWAHERLGRGVWLGPCAWVGRVRETGRSCSAHAAVTDQLIRHDTKDGLPATSSTPARNNSPPWSNRCGHSCVVLFRPSGSIAGCSAQHARRLRIARLWKAAGSANVFVESPFCCPYNDAGSAAAGHIGLGTSI